MNQYSAKFLCLLLVIIFLFSSCSGVNYSTEEDSNSELPDSITVTDISENENTELKIPYDFSEGLNPYGNTSTSNRHVLSLTMRSIVKLDSGFGYTPDLVSDIRSDDSRTWYFYLEDGLTFPNGDEFTAYDLKYSVNCAMDDESSYKKSLDLVSQITVVNATCLKIVLLYPNRNFPSLLFFPVIEYGTIKNPVYFPDRYDFSEDEKSLYALDPSFPIQTIKLCEIDDSDLLTYEMRMGKYDCIYVSDPLLIGTSSVGAISGIQTNRMVYLGLNSSYGFTYYSDFRKAVSASIDYEKIASEIYRNYASAPKGIYCETFYENQYISKRYLDLMSANLLLDDLGFTSYDSEGYRLTQRGKRVSVTLLVCNENSVKLTLADSISEMLKEAGIYTQINAVSYNTYITDLKNGNYDLYIAEIKIDFDNDISKLITPNVYKLSEIEYIDYGVPESEELYLKYYEYMSGGCKLSDFLSVFEDVTPYVPLCFTKSCAIFSRDMSYSIDGTVFDMFYNIKNWQ